MKILPLALPLLLLCGCSAMQPVQEPLNIINLSKGVMAADAGGGWHVAQPGLKFAYRADSTCDIGGARTSCMAWGFEFDYGTDRAPVTLDCESSTVSAVSEKRLDERDARIVEHPFLVVLPAASGHAVYHSAVDAAGASRVMVRCAYDGIERLRFDLLFTAASP